MSQGKAGSATCVLLTATIQVQQGMVFTARTDTQARLADYKQALERWLKCPEVQSVVFIENSGYDLRELVDIARRFPTKTVEFLPFTCREFDPALGKGYGEMLCLEHGLQHSKLLAASPSFLKVTGRYFIANAPAFLRFIDARRDADVICDMRRDLTWADSRAFAGNPNFLRTYFCPMIDELNDSAGSTFEHVLARAAHLAMAHRGLWLTPPFPLQIQGISASRGSAWQESLSEKLKIRVRQALLARFLSSGPR